MLEEIKNPEATSGFISGSIDVSKLINAILSNIYSLNISGLYAWECLFYDPQNQTYDTIPADEAKYVTRAMY